MNSRKIWSKRWSREYARTEKASRVMEYPCENLIRLFKGNYVADLPAFNNSMKILDIGAGDGNNLAFFSTLGLKPYGVEVNKFLANRLKRYIRRKRIKATIKVGHNDRLPFKDNMFDFLVSWNVIHYCDSAELMRKNIEEYARVLKKGGFIFLSTWGLEHRYLKKHARRVKRNLYLIDYEHDARDGMVMFCFETKERLRQYFNSHFTNIEIGRYGMDMMGFDFFILTARKR